MNLTCACAEKMSRLCHLLSFSLIHSFMAEVAVCSHLFIYFHLFIQLVIIHLFSSSNSGSVTAPFEEHDGLSSLILRLREVNFVSYHPTAKSRIQVRRE